VLDAACGVGRHAVAFAERGLSVDGVDVSPTFVEHARERAEEAGVADRARFVEGDLRRLDAAALDPPYDLAVSLFTSFGYFDDATNLRVLEGLHGQLAPDGALAVDVPNREGVLAGFEETGIYEFGGDADGDGEDGDGGEDSADAGLVTEQREYDPETARIRTERHQFRRVGGDLEHEASYDIDLRLYAPVEFRRLCEAAGFRDVTLYGSYDGDDLERESTRLLAVALA
jgi:SAM-dependent methyltransferase